MNCHAPLHDRLACDDDSPQPFGSPPPDPWSQRVAGCILAFVVVGLVAALWFGGGR